MIRLFNKFVRVNLYSTKDETFLLCFGLLQGLWSKILILLVFLKELATKHRTLKVHQRLTWNYLHHLLFKVSITGVVKKISEDDFPERH